MAFSAAQLALIEMWEENYPPYLHCGTCDVTGVKLYRPYGGFLRTEDQRCTDCLIAQVKDRDPPSKENEWQMGWYVCCVPYHPGCPDLMLGWGATGDPRYADVVAAWESLPERK